MINVVTDLLYRTEREREKFNCIFIQQHFKSTGEETPAPTLLLLLLSAAQQETIDSLFSKKKSLPPLHPTFFSSFFKILNRLKTKQRNPS